MPQDKQDDRPAREGDELIDAAAAPKAAPPLTVEEANSATDWLLSDDPDDAEPARKTLDLNVGSAAEPRWVKWEIEAVDEGVLRRLMRSGEVAARKRRGPGGDEGIDTNLGIVTAGTVSPDLREVAKKRNFPDPSLVVRLKFKRKPGLIGQIADEIMSLSGFDTDDVRESREVAAAGN